jgi:hypothetical protein
MHIYSDAVMPWWNNVPSDQRSEYASELAHQRWQNTSARKKKHVGAMLAEARRKARAAREAAGLKKQSKSGTK